MNKNEKIPIKVIADTHCVVTREGHGEWDADDLSWSTTIRGFDVGRNENDYDFFVDPPIKSHYYLVYVTYSTGDSFHHEEGKVCYVELVDTFEEAEAISDAIEKDYRNNKDGFGLLKVKLPTGKKVEVYPGTWKGYFERLSSVDIETIRRSRKIEL